jgi:hypothetical protein
MQKLKINLFGEFWSLRKVILLPEQEAEYQNIANKLNLQLHHALIDPFFYHFLQDKSILSDEDISTIILNGLLDTSKNQIEIWYKNRKIQKFKIADLNNEFLLFPLFNSHINDSKNNLESGIYIEQKEVGSLCFELQFSQEAKFSLEMLHFELYNFKDGLILSDFHFNNQLFEIKRVDTLITHKSSFLILRNLLYHNSRV